MRPLAAIAVLALAGCAQGNIEFTSATGDTARVQFTRFGADTSFTMGPDGSIGYSSNPSAVAQQQIQQGTLQALKMGLLLGGAPATLPGRLLASGEP